MGMSLPRGSAADRARTFLLEDERLARAMSVRVDALAEKHFQSQYQPRQDAARYSYRILEARSEGKLGLVKPTPQQNKNLPKPLREAITSTVDDVIASFYEGYREIGELLDQKTLVADPRQVESPFPGRSAAPTPPPPPQVDEEVPEIALEDTALGSLLAESGTL